MSVAAARSNCRGDFVHDSFSAYLSSMAGHRPISAEEEHVLAVRFRKTGDPEAAKKLMLANLRFVVKVALEYRTYGCELNDLVQEGNLALAEAIRRFDPDMGTRLLTYASFWIRERIRRKIARSRSVSARGTTRAERNLGGSTDGSRRPARDVPLDKVDPSHLTSKNTPDEEVERKEEAELLRKAVAEGLEVLDPRERHIVQAYFLAENPVSLSAIGVEYGISRERVRQLAQRVRRKLRSLLKRRGLTAELLTA